MNQHQNTVLSFDKRCFPCSQNAELGTLCNNVERNTHFHQECFSGMCMLFGVDDTPRPGPTVHSHSWDRSGRNQITHQSPKNRVRRLHLHDPQGSERKEHHRAWTQGWVRGELHDSVRENEQRKDKQHKLRQETKHHENQGWNRKKNTDPKRQSAPLESR